MSGIKFTDTQGAKGSGVNNATSPGLIIFEAARAILNRLAQAVKVSLPENHYSPEGSDQFDIRVAGTLTPGSTETLMSFKADTSQTVRMIRYGMYTNILQAANVDFYPTLNGSRILKYHGDPNDDFRLNFSVGPDLTENSLIPCDILVRPGEVIAWKVTNRGTVSANIGVRMRGFLVNDSKEGNRGFGG